jgi:hypothetical protein
MKLLTCEKCGGNDLFEQNGYRICRYCRSKYSLHAEDLLPQGSIIALDEDIKMLLLKCLDDPVNARRYASLILDIDPSNTEATNYL